MKEIEVKRIILITAGTTVTAIAWVFRNDISALLQDFDRRMCKALSLPYTGI